MFDILFRLDLSVTVALATLFASACVSFAGLLRQAAMRRAS